jgi:homoserine dehydrogenase
MPPIQILKFGSSVLRSSGDLHVAIDEIYRRFRSGYLVLAVVSAFEGITDKLVGEVAAALGSECPDAAAAFIATGESQTAALLHGSLRQYGLPSRIADPREIGLMAQGAPLESMPVRVDRAALESLWISSPILVLPGFFGIDPEGRIALFGRGGSDLSALFLAAALGAECCLLKDVPGVFDADPARSAGARRFSALSWERAIQVAGPLIQPKALHYAHARALSFEVGRPNEATTTKVGHSHDEWERSDDRLLQSQPTSSPPTSSPPSQSTRRPLRVALFGCGVVGRGVYDTLKRYPNHFEIRHVVVRTVDRYPDIPEVSADPSLGLKDSVDVVVVCFGGIAQAYSLIAAALRATKFVVTANKAAVASHGGALLGHTRGANRRLWCSASVGGALPALETLERLSSPVREIRGIVNGTCGVVLDAWADGRTREEAIALAQAEGFAEENPIRDLSGGDSADKLALLIQKAFDVWIDPLQIPTLGIDTLQGDPAGYKLIARATRGVQGIVARIAPERPPPQSFLGLARGPENRLEIELTTGEIVRLRGQGAGRWPTTASVLGDLHEIARVVETSRQAGGSSPVVNRAVGT